MPQIDIAIVGGASLKADDFTGLKVDMTVLIER